MRFAKNALRKAFALLGYELCAKSAMKVSFPNFRNLAQAYEIYLNRIDDLIAGDDLRYHLLARLAGTQPSEAYFIIQALARCRHCPGAVCEFGVAQGETSALIANEIRHSSKILHLFDSFEGLSIPTEKDHLKDDIFSLGSMEAYAGTMSCPEAIVRNRLRTISFPPDRFAVHKGFIEKVLRDDMGLPTVVSFAYVDFDLYKPIKATLEYLHNIVIAGGIIIVDDYDFFSSGVKTAVDEFLEERNIKSVCYRLEVPDKLLGSFAILTRTE